jgi:predicted kinase
MALNIDFMTIVNVQPTAYFLIGVPGSGKSTLVHDCALKKSVLPHFHEDTINNSVRIATDFYIEMWATDLGLTHNDIFKDSIKLAKRYMNNALERAIKNDHSIVWDQTNVSVKNRKNKLDKIPKNYYKVAIFFEVPRDLEARLKSRPGKEIPQAVMDTMKSNLEMPTKEEGFNEIFIIKNEAVH